MKLLHHVYYELKPILPKRFRAALRRKAVRRALEANRRTWPINPASAGKPKNWKGWPEDKQFAVVLTHDVEGQRGYSRIPDLLRAEERLGFRSSFDLIPEGDYVVREDMLQLIRSAGFEVGVHDLKHDGKLYRTKAGFFRAAKQINAYLKQWNAVGFRSAFMHHNLEWLHALEIDYDLSTFDTDPFEPQPDAAGTIFPFWVPSNSGGRGYLEIPYTLVQDSTLFVFLQERTIDVWRQKVDWLAENGGLVLVNVHPDYTSWAANPTFNEFPANLYTELLQYIAQKYAGAYWHGLAKELSAHVSQFKPERTPCEARINPAFQ